MHPTAHHQGETEPSLMFFGVFTSDALMNAFILTVICVLFAN